jgi:hypothetical protein
MNAFVAVLRRELAEKQNIFFAAALLSLGPVILPFVARSPVTPAAEIRSATAFIFAVITAFAVAIYAGLTSFSTELAQRRMSFYFGAPISEWALWGGKLAAAVLLVSSAILVLVPAALIDGIQSLSHETAFLHEFGIPRLLLALMAMILVTNYVAIAARSKSSWALVDCALALALGWVLTLVVRRIQIIFFERTVSEALVIALMIPLLISSAVAVSSGRTDIKRAHRTMSLVFWVGVVAIMALTAGYVAWATSGDLEDFDQLIADEGSTTNDRLVVQGMARLGASVSFLYDLSSRESIRLGSSIAGVVSTESGTAWLHWNPIDHNGELFVTDFPTGKRLSILLPRITSYPAMTMSPDGATLAVHSGSQLLVYEAETGRSVVSLNLDSIPGKRARMFFLDDHRLKLVSAGLVQEVDTRTGTSVQITRLGWNEEVVANRAGDRFLVWSEKSPLVRVIDAGSGRIIASTVLSGLRTSRLSSGRFLEDGRLALPLGPRIDFYREGTLDQSLVIGGESIMIGPQPEPHLLWVATSRLFAPSGEVRLLDLRSGKVIRTLSEVGPSGLWWDPTWASDPRPVDASLANVMIHRESRRPVVVDHRTGSFKFLP